MKTLGFSRAIADKLEVAGRTAASVFGGYLLAHLVALATRHFAPLSAADASRLGAMLAFIVFALAALWCFGVRRHWLVWAGVLGPVAALSALLYIFKGVWL